MALGGQIASARDAGAVSWAAPHVAGLPLHPDPTSASWLSGVLDVALADRYDAPLLIGNLGDARVTLDSATVEVVDAGGIVLANASVPTGGVVAPADDAGETGPGWGAAWVRLLSNASALPPGVVVARVQVSGASLGGGRVEPAALACRCRSAWRPERSEPSGASSPRAGVARVWGLRRAQAGGRARRP